MTQEGGGGRTESVRYVSLEFKGGPRGDLGGPGGPDCGPGGGVGGRALIKCATCHGWLDRTGPVGQCWRPPGRSSSQGKAEGNPQVE